MTTQRHVAPSKYPLQIIAMVDAPLKAKITEIAQENGESFSATIRSLVEVGIAARIAADALEKVVAIYPDETTAQDAADGIAQAVIDHAELLKVHDSAAETRLARLRARGL